MAFEQRDNSGALFRNDDKHGEDANPKWPDYKGTGMVAGIPVWLSGWAKTTKDGAKFLSLTIVPKEKPAEKPAKKPVPAEVPFIDDELLPF